MDNFIEAASSIDYLKIAPENLLTLQI